MADTPTTEPNTRNPTRTTIHAKPRPGIYTSADYERDLAALRAALRVPASEEKR